MERFFKVCMLAVASLLMAACATKPTGGLDYSAYKESKPRSILVLPPVNHSPDTSASLSMMSVTTMPLAEAGYYVLPVALVQETFKENGIDAADDAQQVSAAKLREIFGADAALYISIDEYGSSYRVIKSVTEVTAKAKLIDLRSGAELWHGSAKASSDEQGQSNGGGLIGMLVTAALNQIINDVSDSGHDMARIASARLLATGQPTGLLYGPYNPRFGTD